MTVVARYFRACFIALIVVVLPMMAGGVDRQAAAQGAPCSILALDMGNAWDTESLDSIGGFTYTLVSPAAFATTDLSQHKVIYVGSAFQDGPITVASQAALDALNARAADIATFVLAGGGVVALSEPLGTGRFTWAPLAATPSGHANVEEVLVTAPVHPINVGLTAPFALSYWFVSTHHSFSSADPKYSVLSTTGVGATMTLAALHGDGRIVLTGQDADYHWIEADATSLPDLGAKILLANALNWACEPKPVGGNVVLPDLTREQVVDPTKTGGQHGRAVALGAAAAVVSAVVVLGAFTMRRRAT